MDEATRRMMHSTDATVWAAEFVKSVRAGADPTDEGFMVGWFANAIELARDAGQVARDEREAKLREALRFYADPRNYRHAFSNATGQAVPGSAVVLTDGGDCARLALGEGATPAPGGAAGREG